MFLCEVPQQAESGETLVAALTQHNRLGSVHILPREVLLVRYPDIRVDINFALAPIHALEDYRIRAGDNDDFDETRHGTTAGPVRFTNGDHFLCIGTKRGTHGKYC